MWFFVFRYSKLFGTHATSNVCIYFWQKLFYGHPVGATEVTLSNKKIENQKIFYPCFLVLPYLGPFSSHGTSNFSIYRYGPTHSASVSSIVTPPTAEYQLQAWRGLEPADTHYNHGQCDTLQSFYTPCMIGLSKESGRKGKNVERRVRMQTHIGLTNPLITRW